MAHGLARGVRARASVAFDRTTPTADVAHRQAELVREGVAREMGELGWLIEKRSEKLSAMVVRTKEGAVGVACMRLDRVGTAWLDAGGVIDSLQGDGSAVAFGAVLVVDRAKLSRYGYADVAVTSRPAAGLVEAYRVLRERRKAVLEGAPSMNAPGIHCARCRLAGCPVRSLDGPGV